MLTNVLNHFLATVVMAAELVHAARSESAGEPERLGLGVLFFLGKEKSKYASSTEIVVGFGFLPINPCT